jgi:hypothetical protein
VGGTGQLPVTGFFERPDLQYYIGGSAEGVMSLAVGEMWEMEWKKVRLDPDVISSGVRLSFTFKVLLKKIDQSPEENFTSKSGVSILSAVRLKF